MIFQEFSEDAAKRPFPSEDIKKLAYAGGTLTLGWRGQVYLIFGYRLLECEKLRFMARDAWGVICYLSEDGEVSYPGQVGPTDGEGSGRASTSSRIDDADLGREIGH